MINELPGKEGGVGESGWGGKLIEILA